MRLFFLRFFLLRDANIFVSLVRNGASFPMDVGRACGEAYKDCRRMTLFSPVCRDFDRRGLFGNKSRVVGATDLQKVGMCDFFPKELV